MKNIINTKGSLLANMWASPMEYDGQYQLFTLKSGKPQAVPIMNEEDPATIARGLSDANLDVYFAMARFKDGRSRKAVNAIGASAFWLDIDCGEDKAADGKGYANKREAWDATREFCRSTRIPQPNVIVDSGNGLHIYWILDREIPASEWKAIAEKLKALSHDRGLLADDSRTTDIASVLRVPDTKNYKDPANPKDVKLKHLGNVMTADSFIDAVGTAYSKLENTSFKVEPLSSKKSEPYPFTPENAVEILEAAHAAYPDGITSQESFFTVAGALSELVSMQGWPESEGKAILDEICSKPEIANRSKNDSQWLALIESTPAKIGAGEGVKAHGSLFKKARENGWKPKRETNPEWLDEMNANHFVAPYASTTAIFKKQYDTYTPLRSDAFKLLYANKIVDVVTSEGAKKRSVGDVWIKHPKRRDYDGVGFWPATNPPAGYYNFWQSWPVLPVKGNVLPALTHIEKIICNNDKSLFQYVIGWLAHCVQHPNERGHAALVIMGGRGTGKTVFADWIKAMFGRYAMSIAKGELLTGSFTGHLEQLVVLVAEEAFWAGDKAAENALKHIITGEKLSIHPKGYSPYEAPNYLHLIMTSNEDWVVPAGIDERRFCVCTVNESKKKDTIYFKGLEEWVSSGGIAALLEYLLSYDLDGFDVRTPPDSNGLRGQKLMSLDPVTRWILHRLEIGAFVGEEWKQEYSAKRMVFDLCEHQQLNTYEKRKAETLLGNTLRKIFPDVKKTRSRTNGAREYIYEFPSESIQDARACFEEFTGMTGYDWGDN